MTGRLEGKVALITGSAKGIGAAEARLFAAEGARLVLGDIDEGGLNVLATELTDAGHDVLVQPFDVSQEDQWRSVAKATAGAFGALNVLLNNAGIVDQAGIETTSLVSWDRVVAVNQTGTWLGMKTCVPLMRRSGGGSIINTSSILGIVGAASAAAYQGTKGAVRLLTKGAALEFVKDDIRVNSIHPGVMEAAMSADSSRGGLAAAIPMGRLGRHSEVAYAALFLASDEASYVTGSELVVDGGFTCQ